MHHFAGTSTRSSRRTWGWTPRSTRRPRARCSRRKWRSATSARRSSGGCEARAPRLYRAGGARNLSTCDCQLVVRVPVAGAGGWLIYGRLVSAGAALKLGGAHNEALATLGEARARAAPLPALAATIANDEAWCAMENMQVRFCLASVEAWAKTSPACWKGGRPPRPSRPGRRERSPPPSHAPGVAVGSGRKQRNRSACCWRRAPGRARRTSPSTPSVRDADPLSRSASPFGRSVTLWAQRAAPARHAAGERARPRRVPRGSRGAWRRRGCGGTRRGGAGRGGARVAGRRAPPLRGAARGGPVLPPGARGAACPLPRAPRPASQSAAARARAQGCAARAEWSPERYAGERAAALPAGNLSREEGLAAAVEVRPKPCARAQRPAAASSAAGSGRLAAAGRVHLTSA